jgi:four helix bundle protein
MTYQRFEDLPVWQEAARLYELADDFLAEAPPRLRASFRDQLERAVLSVSNNIAEGFERGTTKELLQFIYIARGSAGEVRSMLTLLLRRGWATDYKPQISKMRSTAENCSRQLRGWADSLQNSEIKGQRHLNDRVRQEEDRQNRSTAFQKQLLSHMAPSNPTRIAAEKKLRDEEERRETAARRRNSTR